MSDVSLYHSPEQWFRHLFRAKSALDGGVVRRKVRDMERMVGRERFYIELHRRCFLVVENAGQVIIFCNSDPVHMTVAPAKSSLGI
ncbi:N-(5'-phosphoribosyl)anthranilate isomerase [uncultured Sulfitobacter sp.]|uniref:N-(5'-phosphoribosyl)anthranilate isomerase n=1 Tax=uncultured Sulfitobacter sp. TaxID=191468 RepID=UPI002637364C|nr:N-(5'-phosphoribosyl)anthranilate isomerase [uncultured Sulfitobacter sp.]